VGNATSAEHVMTLKPLEGARFTSHEAETWIARNRHGVVVHSQVVDISKGIVQDVSVVFGTPSGEG
jgi:hypothetical protein